MLGRDRRIIPHCCRSCGDRFGLYGISRRCAGTGFLGGAFGVEGEETGEHLVTDGVRPAVAVRLLLPAPGGFVDLVVEEEIAVGGDVGPPVGVEDGPVHSCV